MEAELSIYTEILKAIGIKLITPLFIEILLDIVKNTLSSLNIISLFNKKL